MTPINIAIIDDKQSDFFRLHEQIRAYASEIGKIYSCRFHREFLELLKEKELTLVISENEIGGRPDVGLEFFRQFYKENKGLNIYSFLYTWGTYDHQRFRIRIHALNQLQPRFLGAIFKQIGDYEKVLELIESIRRAQPYPLFDYPLMVGDLKEIKQEQRADSEKLIDLHHRIEERLLFFIQIARFHLEHRMGLDFGQTLNEFPGSRGRLLARLNALSEDINELMVFVAVSEQTEREFEVAVRNRPDLGSSTYKGETNPLQLTGFNTTIKKLLSTSDVVPGKPLTDKSEVLLLEFLKNYENLSFWVSRLIETAQSALKNNSRHTTTESTYA